MCPSFHLPPPTPGLASGTGSVLKIQELLHICSESHKPEEEGEEGGEGGGKKSGESDSKTAGKTKDKKDQSEGKLSSGEERYKLMNMSLSVDIFPSSTKRGGLFPVRARQPPGPGCAGDRTDCNGRRHWS